MGLAAASWRTSGGDYEDGDDTAATIALSDV